MCGRIAGKAFEAIAHEAVRADGRGIRTVLTGFAVADNVIELTMPLEVSATALVERYGR